MRSTLCEAGVVVDEAAEDVVAEDLRRPDVASPCRCSSGGAPRCSRCARGCRASSRCRPPRARPSGRGNRSKTGSCTRSTGAHLGVEPEQGDRRGERRLGRDVGAPPRPKCRHSGMSASCAAARNGSQWSVWNDGSPRACGLSVNETALAPFAATRCALGDGQRRCPRTGRGPAGSGGSGYRGAPLVDHPVVARLTRTRPPAPCPRMSKNVRAGEPGKRREAQLGVDAVQVHVLDALLGVVAARAASRRKRTGSRPILLPGLPATAFSPMVGYRVPSISHTCWVPVWTLPSGSTVSPVTSTILGPRSPNLAGRRPLKASRCSTTWSSTEQIWTSAGSGIRLSQPVDDFRA